MPYGHLMDSQVRELREAIRASGLDENSFGWEMRDAGRAGYFGLPMTTHKEIRMAKLWRDTFITLLVLAAGLRRRSRTNVSQPPPCET